MAVAAITPRVRSIIICDDVTESPIEDRVFNIEGARLQFVAQSLPWSAAPKLYLVLSSPRKGRYPGKVLLIDDQTERSIRYVKFLAEFHRDNELLPLYVEVGECQFPGAGPYRFEIYFSARGDEALKGEFPLTVVVHED
jgi:hypothetical protein